MKEGESQIGDIETVADESGEFTKEELLNRKVEVKANILSLRQELKDQLDELRQLEALLASFEPEPEKDIVHHQDQGEYITFREFLGREVDLSYAKNAALGTFAASGGFPGIVNNPERFFYNLGVSVVTATSIEYLERTIDWLRYRNQQRRY